MKRKAEEEEKQRKLNEEEETKKSILNLPQINISAVSTTHRSSLDSTTEFSRRYPLSITGDFLHSNRIFNTILTFKHIGTRHNSLAFDSKRIETSPNRGSHPTLITAPKLEFGTMKKPKASYKFAHKKATSLLSPEVIEQLRDLGESLHINLNDIKPTKTHTGENHS